MVFRMWLCFGNVGHMFLQSISSYLQNIQSHSAEDCRFQIINTAASFVCFRFGCTQRMCTASFPAWCGINWPQCSPMCGQPVRSRVHLGRHCTYRTWNDIWRTIFDGWRLWAPRAQNSRAVSEELHSPVGRGGSDQWEAFLLSDMILLWWEMHSFIPSGCDAM